MLEDWCAHSGDRRAIAWVSLDVDDNDPVRFWSYCIEALVRARPDLRTDTARMLGIRGIDARRDVLPHLLHDVAGLPGEVLLILDDYHIIASRDVHDSVTFVLDHLPPALRVGIATRSDPPLPLPRLRVRGELTELRAAELRFTEDETAELLQDVLDLGLRGEDVVVLHRRTEGWAAGLYLAALSVQGRSDSAAFVAAFAGDDRHIVDYLGAEVLAEQPAQMQAFLLHTSILRRLADRCATPSPAARTAPPCWSRSNTRTCSWSRSTRPARGTAITTCSANCSSTSWRSPSRSWSPRCTVARRRGSPRTTTSRTRSVTPARPATSTSSAT